MDSKKVARAFHKAMASKNFDTLWEVMTEDAKFILNDQVYAGHDEIKESFEGFWEYVPDIDYGTPEIFLATDDRVALTHRVSGTKVCVNGRTYRVKWQFPVAALVITREGKVAVWHEFLNSASLDKAILSRESK
jgi:ketosteroid isomerase-like protein